MVVYNMDIFGIVRRIRKFRFELAKAVSSNLAHVSAADFGRAKSYLDAVVVYLDHAVGQKILDCPETSPLAMEIGDLEKIELVENDAVVDLIKMYEVLETELVNSQSARMTNSLIPHDEKRARAIIERMQSFLDGYISNILPLDLPESSPLRPMSGDGRKGV